MKRPWRQSCNPGENNAPAKRAKASPMLRRYLEEMGATPLLDDAERAAAARASLRDARLAIAKLAQTPARELPRVRPCRRRVRTAAPARIGR